MVVRMGGSRQGFGGASRQLRPHRAPFGANLCHAERGRSVARNHDEVDSPGQKLWQCSEAFAAETFDPVPQDGAPHPSCHHDSQPSGPRGGRLRCDEKGEVRRTYAPARPLRVHEFAMLAKPSLVPCRDPAGSPLWLQGPGHAVVQPAYFL
jgi:hypothetical protein